MNPFATLIRKELRQHWLAFLVVLLAGAIILVLLILGQRADGDDGSIFITLHQFLWFFGILSCLALGNRLLVSEFNSPAQLYLEVLPVARWKMIASKYLIGAVIIFLITAGALMVSLVLGASREALDFRFFLILSARSFGIIAFIYSFLFFMGTFGRYRFFLYVVYFLGLMFMDEYFGWDTDKLAPFALAGDRFAFERTIFPWADFGGTLLLAAGFSVGAFVSGCLRDGDLSRKLGEKMSYREKVFLGCTIIGGIVVFMVFDERKPKPDYTMSGGAEAEHALTSAKTAGPEDEAAALSTHLASEIGAAAEFLGYTSHIFPTIFTARRRDLDPSYFEPGDLSSHEGILSRANYTDPEFELPAFTAWTLRRALLSATRERGEKENVRWVLDGFPLWWTHRNQAEKHSMLHLRALFATRGTPSGDLLTRWNTTRDTFGVPIAEAVAWSVLDSLATAEGEEAVRDLARAALPASQFLDVRELFANPHFESAPPALVATWKRAQQKSWREHQKTILSIPQPTAAARFDGQKRGRALLLYTIALPGEAGGLRFRYQALDPFEYELDPTATRTINFLQGNIPGDEQITAEDWQYGARLAYTAEFISPTLGCAVISGWKRISATF